MVLLQRILWSVASCSFVEINRGWTSIGSFKRHALNTQHTLNCNEQPYSFSVSGQIARRTIQIYSVVHLNLYMICKYVLEPPGHVIHVIDVIHVIHVIHYVLKMDREHLYGYMGSMAFRTTRSRRSWRDRAKASPGTSRMRRSRSHRCWERNWGQFDQKIIVLL